jgi:hypothetical protein
MTERWNPDGMAYRVASALFDGAERASAILADAEGERGIGPTDLMGYISDPHHRRAARIEAALNVDAKLRGDFEHLMRRMAMVSIPRLAAASSGMVTTRTAEGCRITLRPSRADSSQVYVVIKLDDLAAAPQSLFVWGSHRSPLRHPLPPPQGGNLQVLMDEASELVSALRDVDAEVFLR